MHQTQWCEGARKLWRWSCPDPAALHRGAGDHTHPPTGLLAQNPVLWLPQKVGLSRDMWLICIFYVQGQFCWLLSMKMVGKIKDLSSACSFSSSSSFLFYSFLSSFFLLCVMQKLWFMQNVLQCCYTYFKSICSFKHTSSHRMFLHPFEPLKHMSSHWMFLHPFEPLKTEEEKKSSPQFFYTCVWLDLARNCCVLGHYNTSQQFLLLLLLLQ